MYYKSVQCKVVFIIPSVFADYTPSGIPVTVTIPASAADMRACFTGPIIDDLIALEPNETFTLSITDISPDDSRIQAGIETTRITIIDDDGELKNYNQTKSA